MKLEIFEREDRIEIYQSLGEGAGSIVKCFGSGVIELWEIPQYGGEERYYRNCTSIQDALSEGRTWT
jgi:hypothetical protein